MFSKSRTRVLKTREEAYGWVAFNYKMGNFDQEELGTMQRLAVAAALNLSNSKVSSQRQAKNCLTSSFSSTSKKFFL